MFISSYPRSEANARSVPNVYDCTEKPQQSTGSYTVCSGSWESASFSLLAEYVQERSRQNCYPAALEVLSKVWIGVEWKDLNESVSFNLQQKSWETSGSPPPKVEVCCSQSSLEDTALSDENYRWQVSIRHIKSNFSSVKRSLRVKSLFMNRDRACVEHGNPGGTDQTGLGPVTVTRAMIWINWSLMDKTKQLTQEQRTKMIYRTGKCHESLLKQVRHC